MDSSTSGGENELHVKVYDPVKQGEGIGAYVSYRVESKTTLANYHQSENEVIRRFKDFAWLQDRLGEKNPGVIVPPLPEKDVVQKFSMGTDFIQKRCHALDVFLNRLSKHPILKFSSELQFFLEANETSWQEEVARTTSEQGTMKKTFQGAKSFFKGMTQTASNLISGKSSDEQEDPEYLKVRTYINSLETHLTEVYRHAELLVSRQNKLSKAMIPFADAMLGLGDTDVGSVAPKFIAVAQKIKSISDDSQVKIDQLDMEFVEPMKEYSRYVRSVKNVINGRSNALQRMVAKEQSVESKKQTLAKLRATPGVKEEKLSDVEQALNESSRKYEEAKETYALIQERMKTEMKQYHDERKRDMLKTMAGLAEKQAALADQQAVAWKALVAELV